MPLARSLLADVRSLVRAALGAGIGLLLAIVCGAALLGQRPTVVTSDSMRPGVAPGDIVLLARTPETVGAPMVIAFGTPEGKSMLHRIVGQHDGAFITKGDANTAIDAAPVDSARITGVARMLVPYLGQPLIWVHRGEWAQLLILVLFVGWLALPASVAGPQRCVVKIWDLHPSEIGRGRHRPKPRRRVVTVQPLVGAPRSQ